MGNSSWAKKKKEGKRRWLIWSVGLHIHKGKGIRFILLKPGTRRFIGPNQKPKRGGAGRSLVKIFRQRGQVPIPMGGEPSIEGCDWGPNKDEAGEESESGGFQGAELQDRSGKIVKENYYQVLLKKKIPRKKGKLGNWQARMRRLRVEWAYLARQAASGLVAIGRRNFIKGRSRGKKMSAQICFGKEQSSSMRSARGC